MIALAVRSSTDWVPLTNTVACDPSVASMVGAEVIVTLPCAVIDTRPASASSVAVFSVSSLTVTDPDVASMMMLLRLMAPSPELMVGAAAARVITA